MESAVLYRKYRPKKFAEVLGQDHIVNILQNAVKLKRISHAYLFAGPRGSGKTSVARILASEAGASLNDVIEIDAASSRGIDEIRALREAVRLSPLESPYKVYIIDEVHMLTKEAFNALLKTLEEPPAHAIFILATTELDKVPVTIISRCQSFQFRKLPESIIQKSIINIAKKEGFTIDDESAGLVALLSDGSFRDAQSLLDQIISGINGNEIKGNEVRRFLAVPQKELIEDFIIAILKKDTEKGIEPIRKMKEAGLDVKIFLKLVLRDLQFILLMKIDKTIVGKLEDMLGESEFKFLENYKNDESVSIESLARALNILLGSYDSLGSSYLPDLPLELALVKISA
ncbi:MAG: DNA polymerase III subunit gamma/tau [Parcubacteria group bacterium]|nr:DNA polymerase III subunit gamma/tau [Parcubacteria group bacterium]MCR4343004.1 DNA polymerase III subunit gamma/tau [Patescibacteria group bacterium]